ncbi:hypothetical protein [Clostridium sp. ZS2-4]|uniref:hypothetical protein n=1 Tax=Clostridium sp. ZS2-4 TaxID=2987703 RepID=UPI00227BE9EF|nr:hypothetical protein [Clostridium sp. ZS2-4]MCY6355881.1 hypothetical protein [Clostridium sp. ZS2-4]
MARFKLDKDLENRIEELRLECIECYQKGNIEEAINKMLEAWSILPYPKTIYSESFTVVELIIELYIRNKEFEKGNKWVDLVFICCLRRIDGGDREFIAGKLAYEQGNLEKAKELFFVANLKSDGRIFENKDFKYIKLIK